ncbi:hypothetical protein ABE049_26160 [Priestia megaterium]
MELISLFSRYELKARLFPALLVLAPLLFTVLIWYPELIDWQSSFFTILVSVVILFFLAKLSREMGIKRQKKLLVLWGGFPSTIMLRHRDTTIDPITKERYHEYLEKYIDGIKIPTAEEELENPEFYDKHYGSAIKWLLEKTRDATKYDLLLQDNINYGFSRNMLGIKPIGIIFSIVALMTNIYGAYQKYQLILLNLPLKIWFSLLVSTTFILLWVLFVKANWVTNTSQAYARTLLATCEDVEN